MTGRPVVAALAVLVADNQVLLVRRANPPDRGKWGFPGGKIERGEPVTEAARRELAEETGVTAEAMDVLTALDVIGTDHHYVLVAVRCQGPWAAPVAGDDAAEARWFVLSDLATDPSAFSIGVEAVARQAGLTGTP